MTLIECFTQAHIDNIGACLRLCPDKVFFVGNAEEMEEPVERYKAFFAERNLKTMVDTRNADDKDFGDLRAVIYDLILQSEECVIDLTGGEPSVALAIGAALADLSEEKRKRVRVEWFDHQSGMVVDYIHDNCRRPGKTIRLTAKEIVTLHGGKIHPDPYKLPADWNRSDFNRLWRVVSGMPKQWNDAVGQLKRFEKYAISEEPVRVELEELYASIPQLREKESMVRELLEMLDKEGVIADKSNHYALQYTYKSEFLRHCIQKQGNVLEIKTLLEGQAVREDGMRFFHDCWMSVNIDWDGYVPKSKYAFAGTTNEIDVILLHGATPLFISCKNGDVKTEELYKLHTVATRFGGPYARKMLIAADMEDKEDTSVKALTRRAWDMDIFLVTDAAELSDEDWQEIFLKPYSDDPEKAMEEALNAGK